MRPVVVVLLVTHQDRPVLPAPQDEVPVAGMPGIEVDEMRVDALVVQRRHHVAADLVVADMGGQCGREAQAGHSDGGVGRVPTRLDGEGVLEGDLAAERQLNEGAPFVGPGADLCGGQPDEDVGRGVAHAQDVDRRHGFGARVSCTVMDGATPGPAGSGRQFPGAGPRGVRRAVPGPAEQPAQR